MAGPAAAKSACSTPEEVKAVQLRQLHNELQVAALNCRGDDPSMPGRYAAYVQRFGPALNSNAGELRRFFARTAGGDGNRGLDHFNTAVTNRESVRVHEIPGYCELHAPMFDKLMGMDQHQLVTFAAETVGTPEAVRSCGSPAKDHAKKSHHKKKADEKTAQAQ
jgi:hypothetical protein